MQLILQFPQLQMILQLLKKVLLEVVLLVKLCCNLRGVFKQSSGLFTVLASSQSSAGEKRKESC